MKRGGMSGDPRARLGRTSESTAALGNAVLPSCMRSAPAADDTSQDAKRSSDVRMMLVYHTIG